MKVAPKPANETRRLQVLERYAVLDSAEDPAFDRIVGLVQRMLDVPIALVSLVDAERQWFKACIGLGDTRETSRDVAFCAHAILQDDVFEIPDALADARFADNPLVTGPPHVRAYVGAPLITPERLRVGTLCAIDTKPRDFSPEQIASLVDLAAVVVTEMELRRTARDRRLFERVTETSPNMMYVVDATTRNVTWSSRAGTEMLGYPTDLVGRNITPDMFHPDDLPVAAEHYKKRRDLANDAFLEASFRFKAANGQYRWLLVRERVFERARDGSVKECVGIATDVTALKEAEARVAALAVTDTLTGLPNRRALDSRLELLAAEAARGRRYAIAICDVDHFKKVNDTHGHGVGDQVLQAVGAALRDCVRKADLAARMGGEEFCVIYTDADPDLLPTLVERLRRAVETCGSPVPVTASFGVCHSGIAPTPHAMLEAADAALYRAKAGGRNRAEVCSPR